MFSDTEDPHGFKTGRVPPDFNQRHGSPVDFNQGWTLRYSRQGGSLEISSRGRGSSLRNRRSGRDGPGTAWPVALTGEGSSGRMILVHAFPRLTGRTRRAERANPSTRSCIASGEGTREEGDADALPQGASPWSGRRRSRSRHARHRARSARRPVSSGRGGEIVVRAPHRRLRRRQGAPMAFGSGLDGLRAIGRDIKSRDATSP